MTEVQSTYWDKEILVKEVTTGNHTVMRVSVTQKKGETYVAYREWYNTKSDPTYKLSKHGGVTKLRYAAEVGNAIMIAATKGSELGWTK